MPIKQNAKKALRQNIKRAVINKKRKNNFREAIKVTTKTTDAQEAKKLVILAQKALDKAVKTGTIKKNAAARKLSRLMKKVNALKK